MSIELDHIIVPARDRSAAAEQLGEILGVPWSADAPIGPFSPVYVSDGLTIDFDEAQGDFPVLHYAFRVDDAQFDAIISRLEARGIGYRGAPSGPFDNRINTSHGGRIAYWTQPEGHMWEALTVSYAREPHR